MPDKNIVDDYYAKIPSEGSSDKKDTKSTQSKPKIVARKKIVAKKKTPVAEKKETPSQNTQRQEKKPYKSSGVIQKISVVKRDPKTDSRPSAQSARPARSNNSGSFQGKRYSSDTKPGTNKPETGFKTRGQNTTEKKFFNDKKPAQSNQKGSDKKDPNKGKLNPNERRTRGRFRGGYEEANKPLEFTRSNKMAKNQKEEKKIEDIQQNLVDKKGETVIISDFVTLKELSEKLGVVLPKLMAEFMKNGVMVNINSKIDFDTASLIAEAFEVTLDRDISAGGNTEDIVSGNIEELMKEDDSSKLSLRSPVISIMGHVDHGKTSLLDYIRKAKVASGEAGGITQSIGAYQVEMDNGNITFLDTPGHEAFTIMRARGARSTDIAILVVAADEGVKPQTIESINHAKEAGIPVIVALNKMDKEGANPDHIKGQLAEHGLTPEDWGGDTPMIPVSAHTGFGIDDLLEIILLVSEMKELKANPNRNGIATVIESHLDLKLGPVATVLVNTGTINSTDLILCQDSYGKIKILKNYANQSIKKALPGQPVLIVGLDKVVNGGDILQVMPNIDAAKQKAAEYKIILEREKSRSASGLDLLMSKIRAGNLKQLKIILKADTNGSLEAMKAALVKLSTDETNVTIIHGGVGGINEGDIHMGQGSSAILVGFNVGVLPTAKGIIESSGVEHIESNIIYHITERIEKIVTGMLDPKEVEIGFCRAQVGGIFYSSKEFMILGLRIKEDEKIQPKTHVRIFRKDKYIGKGEITSLKQGMLEVKELEGPIECGIQLKTSTKVEENDILEVYRTEIQK